MSGSLSFINAPASSNLTLGQTNLGSALLTMLMADDIVPGSEPSYQLCKDILLYHPLGAKIAETPGNMAQSQPREIDIPGAPAKVREAFEREWLEISADITINNTFKLARVYGIASVVVGAVGIDSDKPLPQDKLASESLFFNVLDPLNTAGSLVLSQDTNSPSFQKTTVVTTEGKTYHRSRVCVVMNEEPVFIAFTNSAFGFVGRSVYQRALFPLKSFIQTMITDDMVARKVGVLIAKMKAPGSIIDRAMQRLMGAKRALLQQAKADNVLGIDIEESVESLNMQNVDGAGNFARTNILKNIATAADMPAKLLENETLVEGFAEGQEDAKMIARYIERIRIQMKPLYDFFDQIVQARAWNPEFYKDLQRQFPEQYGKVKYATALSRWQNNFTAKWPSLLIEPESERVKTDDVKLRAIVAVLEALIPHMDPENKGRVFEWAADNIGDTELLFSVPLSLDIDALKEYEPPQPGMPGMEGGGGAPGQGPQQQGGGQGDPSGVNKVQPFKMPAMASA